MNDLTGASKKAKKPPTKVLITLKGSLQHVSLNVFLNFVDYLSQKKEDLTVEVDVLQDKILDP